MTLETSWLISAELESMDIHQLRASWQKLYGWKPALTCKRQFLLGNLHYEQQCLIHGGLSSATKKRIIYLAERFKKNPRYRPSQSRSEYTPGTRFLREYKGKTYEVIVKSEGFTYQGQTFNSLSSIANAITGASWNGRKFFGLSHGINI